jgi:hypothetical protein
MVRTGHWSQEEGKDAAVGTIKGKKVEGREEACSNHPLPLGPAAQPEDSRSENTASPLSWFHQRLLVGCQVNTNSNLPAVLAEGTEDSFS